MMEIQATLWNSCQAPSNANEWSDDRRRIENFDESRRFNSL